MKATLEEARRFFALSPFMVDLGIEPIEVGEGRMVTTLTVQPRHLQHTGVVHAGVLATLADHSMGAAAQTLAPPAHWILTAELKTSMLRGALADRLVCEARVLKAGRMISFTEAEVFAETAGGRVLCMKASATMAVAPDREARR